MRMEATLREHETLDGFRTRLEEWKRHVLGSASGRSFGARWWMQ
jgi:hypothetical protein